MESITTQQEDDFAILVKIPRPLVALLDAEAKKEQRNRTRQVIRILEERYGLVEQAESAA